MTAVAHELLASELGAHVAHITTPRLVNLCHRIRCARGGIGVAANSGGKRPILADFWQGHGKARQPLPECYIRC